jgi:hypothetical protein
MRKILKKKSKLDNLRIQIGEKLGRVITYWYVAKYFSSTRI